MDDPGRLLADAQAMHSAGRLEQAAAGYSAAAACARRVDPPASAVIADADYGLGTVLMGLGRHRQALALLDAAIAANAAVPEYHFNRALVHQHLGQVEQAAQGFRQSVVLAGGDPALLQPAAERLLRLGRPADALELLRAGPPPLTAPLVALEARAMAARGDWAGAIGRCRELTDAAPTDPALWRLRFRAAGQLRDYQDAIDSFERFAGLSPPSAQDWLAFADLLLAARRPERARAALAEARALGASGAGVDYLEARLARAAGELEAARGWVDSAIAKRPGFGAAWTLLADMAASDETAGLARQVGAALETPDLPDHDYALAGMARGRLLERCGLYDQAFAAWESANARHKRMLIGRGAGYDPAREEASWREMLALFPVPSADADADAGQAMVPAQAPPVAPSAADGTPSPIFIVGMPRSGTTLMERMLCGLPGVLAGGENEALEFVAASYYHALRHGRAPAPTAAGASTWGPLRSDYWARSPVRSGPWATDKMPHNARHVGLITRLFPAAPVIWMQRDPRDVALSIFSRMFPDGHRYACDLDWLAHFIVGIERMMAYWQRLPGHRVLAVRYEQLVESPEAVSREVAAFCGLEWSPDCLAVERRTEAAFTFSELQVRRPLNREGIGRWRHYADQLAGFRHSLERYRGAA